jgi:hypothetical protein
MDTPASPRQERCANTPHCSNWAVPFIQRGPLQWYPQAAPRDFASTDDVEYRMSETSGQDRGESLLSGRINPPYGVADREK